MTTTLEAKPKGAGANQARSRQQRWSRGMEARVDLSKPYEAGLATVLSLPAIHQTKNYKKRLTKKIRNLYQAANGRFVSTSLGSIAIAPAVAPWLKETPLFFATQEEFFSFVAKLRARAGTD